MERVPEIGVFFNHVMEICHAERQYTCYTRDASQLSKVPISRKLWLFD